MTSRIGRLAYAHGHLGARMGARPASADWARLQAITDAHSFVEAARRTRIAPFMGGITPSQPIHTIEALLRERWREEVRQVSRWYEHADRSAVEWLSWLAELPAIAYLTAANPVTEWMETDSTLAPFVAAAAGDKDALSNRSGLTAFARAFSGEEIAQICWLDHWRALWPKAKAERISLERLLAKIAELSGGRDLAAIALPTPDVLDQVFEKAFRANPKSLTAGVAYLGLVADDLRRLRGQIAVRLALPALERQEAAA
ncbi:MAG: hypothetical protein LJE67_11160 [Salaquimonas sp.]|nr:hypothetical protein [Salaquimonas sp.]